ncbi:hypothetical protein CFIO01_12658 [Colletotrichum fioriniae PJ7]|uniref:Uncharacterized protein n=1 Tax=Colletotrichum fioriniae PJ7 TaxID=1445577 RepID=A0A010RWA3_9PEZI|nr:hypothetical protein CFIO01_12658 [Colletotrichum fioriniae PJ7]
MKRSGDGGGGGGNTASCRKRMMYPSVVVSDFFSLLRSIATTDDRTGTRSGMQPKCLTLSIGVSQQWKCHSESEIQVPGRTGERLPIEERLPLPYRSFPAIPQSYIAWKSVSLRRTQLNPVEPDLFRARDNPILYPGLTLVRENGGSCFA